MENFIGIGLAAAVRAFAMVSGFDRQRVFYPTSKCLHGKLLRCSVADLFKKFSGSVQSSARPPGLLWGVAKIIGSEGEEILWNIWWP
jgi:hypothetical protein